MDACVRPPAAKKAKRSTPVSRVSAIERAKQFKDELYADGDVLFCKYCQHSVDFVRIDTIKDHLKSKKHCTRKEAKTSESGTSAKQASSGKQLTLSTVMKSKDLREGFVLDFVKVLSTVLSMIF